jgi:hypothetical protein
MNTRVSTNNLGLTESATVKHQGKWKQILLEISLTRS